MNLEKIQTALNDYGIKIGFFNKQVYKVITDIIPDDEIILQAGEGHTDKNSIIPIIITENNVYLLKLEGLLKGAESAVIPIEKIQECVIDSQGIVYATIKIKASNKIYYVQKINKVTISKLVNKINELSEVKDEEKAAEIASKITTAVEYKKLYARWEKKLDQAAMTENEVQMEKYDREAEILDNALQIAGGNIIGYWINEEGKIYKTEEEAENHLKKNDDDEVSEAYLEDIIDI